MSDEEQAREPGLPPGGEPASGGAVRSELTRGNVLGQFLMWGCAPAGCSGGLLALAFAAAIVGLRHIEKRDAPILLIGFPMCVLLAALVAAVTRGVLLRANRWVELEGDVIRSQNLFTRRVTERSLDEVRDFVSQAFEIAGPAEPLADAIRGRVPGFEIRFRERGQPLQVFSPEMDGVSELADAIVARLEERAPVVAEVLDRAGRPALRRLHWERPGPAGAPPA